MKPAPPVIWQNHGWTVARSGALLSVAWTSGRPVTVDAAHGLGQQLLRWARDPDLYAVLLTPSVAELEMGLGADDAGRAIAELIWRLACFSKPTVTLMHAPAGDLGWALACAGTHQAVGAGFRLRLDAEAGCHIPPGNLLAALMRHAPAAATAALEGSSTFGPRAAHAAGLATHVTDAAASQAIIAGLADAEPVDPLFDTAAVDTTATDAVATTRHENAPRSSWRSADLLRRVADAPLDQAIIAACRHDEALASAGAEAATAELADRLARSAFSLPPRRALQAFRSA